MIKTPFTELFGCKHPIMLAGMNWVTTPELVAAVCNAGGLGIFATARCTPEEARQNIRKIRELTDKPFGINQLLILGQVARDVIDVAIQEKVPVINYTLGKPWFIDQVHAYGGKVIGTTAVAKHAAKAAQLGCDAVVVTGHEAAAHGDKATSMVLIPVASSSVKIPIIAAGGIYDGRGLAAALALGAEGVSMGTRFMLTKECVLHDNFKKLCLAATEQDTLYDTVFDGMWGRALKSKGAEDLQKKSIGLLERFQAAMKIRKVLNISYRDFMAMGIKTMMAGDDGLSLWAQASQAVGAVRSMQAIYEGDTEKGFLFAGQNIGGIKDIPTVRELILRVVAEAEQTVASLKSKCT
jgi:enoyl-[acyl-carrier protein] reductase II